MTFHKPLKITIKNHFQQDLKKVEMLYFKIKVFREAMFLMGETISDMDIELEQKDNKIQFSENKIGIPDSQVIEEMNRLNINKISSIKMTGLWIGLIKHLTIINTFKIKWNTTKIFKEMFCFHNDMFIETTLSQLFSCFSIFVYNPIYLW